MEESKAMINMNNLDHGRFRSWGFSQDFCVTCGLCASSCPASGVDGFDPRKFVRMLSLGMINGAGRIPLALDLHDVRQV